MADVRSGSGAPQASFFGGVATPSPGTPLYVDTATGDLYVLLGNTPTKVGQITDSSSLVLAMRAFVSERRGPELIGLNARLGGFIDLKSIPHPGVPPSGTGRLRVAEDAGFTVIQFDDNRGIDVQINRDVVHVVRNNTGGTLAIGTVVYITGSTGVYATVDKADASNPAKMPAFGLVAADISASSFGQVMSVGHLRGFDTSGFAQGAELYVSASSPGEMTPTAPSGVNSRQLVATVITSGPGNSGIVEVLTRAQILSSFIDHGNVTGLTDDDHPQYNAEQANQVIAAMVFGRKSIPPMWS